MNSRTHIVAILSCILLFCASWLSAATTYYVGGPGASDSNPGTAGAPFATIQKAADLVNPGDTVDVRPGTYTGAKFSRSGTSGSQITIHGEAGAIVNSSPSQNTNHDNLWIRDASYITIEGFEVKTAGRSGIAVQGEPAPDEVHGIIIQNNNCHDNSRWGIFTGYAEGITIRNNNTSFSGLEHGIYVSNSADNPVITGNISHDNHASGIQINADPALAGDGIISNAVMDSNIIYNNGVGGGAAINLASVVNSRFSNNLLYGNHAGGIAGWDDGNCPCPPSGGFIFGTHDNKIYNNTIVQASDGRFAISLLDGSTNNEIKNNILMQETGRGSINMDSTSEPGTNSDYNAVVNVFSADDGDHFITLAAWQARGHDAHSFVTNSGALFVNAGANDYHLSATSPALDTGTPVSLSLDLEGNSRPQGPKYDIGAYEKVQCAGDSTVPTVNLTSPTNGATVNGTISISANASDNCSLSRVEFYLGNTLLSSDTASPFTMNWNSHSVSNGPYVVKAKAIDSIGNNATSQANITVNNTGLFFDDFSDNNASDWTPDKGVWSVVNQALTGTVKKGTEVSPNFTTCTQCTVEANLSITTALSRASVIGWYQDGSDNVEVMFQDDSDKIQVIQKSAGQKVAKKSVSFPITPGANLHLLISYDGTNFNLTVNGSQILVLKAGAVPPAMGHVAFRVAKGQAPSGKGTSSLTDIQVY
jgi:parallel beta-helix repeat protein